MGEQEHRGRQLKRGRPQGEDDDVLKSNCWPQQSRQLVVVPFSFLRSEFPPGGRYGAMAIRVGEIGQRIPPARPPALVALASPGAEPFLNDHLQPARSGDNVSRRDAATHRICVGCSTFSLAVEGF